jgi:hypothetical protein
MCTPFSFNKVNFSVGFTGACLLVLGYAMTNDRYDAVLTGLTDKSAGTLTTAQQNLNRNQQGCSFAAPFGSLTPKPSTKKVLGKIFSRQPTRTGMMVYEIAGLGFFILGWLMLILAAATYCGSNNSMNSSSIKTYTANPKMAPVVIGTGLAALAGSMMAWYYLSTSHVGSSVAGYAINLFAVASWIGFAVAIGYKDGSLKKERFALALVGATCIMISFLILSYARRLQVPTSSKTPPSLDVNSCPNVFNIGMPLFTFGVILVALGAAKD